MFNKVAIGGMAALVCLLITMPVAAASNSLPAFQGRATVLLDGVSGQVLYQMNGSDKNYPASTTKILTALVAVEHGNLDQMIAVSARAVDQPPDSSSCYLEKGEQQSLKNLLYGLLLASGNDCAVAIAEGVTEGHPEQFVAWMNETATRLGATHSHFANPSGLHESDHYTTAFDLGIIARTALNSKTLREISGTKEFYWPVKSDRNGLYYNHNQLLFNYTGTFAGKTGYTEEARHTLVNAVERDGRLLIGVVMGETAATIRDSDMRNILDYGFTQFEEKNAILPELYPGSIAVTEGLQNAVPLAAKAAFPVSVLKGTDPKVTLEPKLEKSIAAPVAAGQQVGALEIREGARVLGSVPLIARQGIEAKPKVTANLLKWALAGAKWLAYALGGLLLFRTVVKAVRRAVRRTRSTAGGYRRMGGKAGSIVYYRTKGD